MDYPIFLYNFAVSKNLRRVSPKPLNTITMKATSATIKFVLTFVSDFFSGESIQAVKAIIRFNNGEVREVVKVDPEKCAEDAEELVRYTYKVEDFKFLNDPDVKIKEGIIL